MWEVLFPEAGRGGWSLQGPSDALLAVPEISAMLWGETDATALHFLLDLF